MKAKATRLLVMVLTFLSVIGSYVLFVDKTMRMSRSNIRNIGIWYQTPAWDLALAVRWQQIGRIRYIVTAKPSLLNFQEPRYGATLLIWAVGIEKYKAAEALLQCGADPNIATSRAGETALFIAADYSWVDFQLKHTDPKYVKLLLKFGADPNICYNGNDPYSNITDQGTSPLMASIGCGIEKTRALIEGGSDINIKSVSGTTAAILALWEGVPFPSVEDIKYAELLIVEKKAKVTDCWQEVPGKVANQRVKIYPVSFLRDIILPIDSSEYIIKKRIIAEYYRQGVDYYATEIPEERLQQIKKLYPTNWKEYAAVY